ncbi:UNVERIFIED_ORG: hypothetical protein BDU10_5291 [Burkholderia sp. CF145]|jgi:hypothetical protein|nr:hypothetical protein PMI06_003306 [Burkholderia sp. BT03]SKC59221.1 hypothetical protein SAMN06266956_1026 [Paraburkholderia hospita]
MERAARRACWRPQDSQARVQICYDRIAEMDGAFNMPPSPDRHSVRGPQRSRHTFPSLGFKSAACTWFSTSDIFLSFVRRSTERKVALQFRTYACSRCQPIIRRRFVGLSKCSFFPDTDVRFIEWFLVERNDSLSLPRAQWKRLPCRRTEGAAASCAAALPEALGGKCCATTMTWDQGCLHRE